MLAALSFYAATHVLMEPLHTAGPMNFSFEEPIGTLLIAVGISALGIAAWKKSATTWTWSISLCALGAILLVVIIDSVAHHPPSEGQQDPSGLIPPTDYSMGLAYGMAFGLILVGIGLILKKGFKKQWNG